MIVKNEEAFLPGCLESVQSFVDEMIVVDTGSQDRTVEIARSYGAKVHHFPWIDDFAAARNESLRHATSDWIIYLDADERLVCCDPLDGPRQAIEVEGADAYTVPILSHKRNGEQRFIQTAYNIRLFRRFPGIRFEGQVHERVEPFLQKIRANQRLATFRIEHLGYDIDYSEEQKKLQRNLALIRKHVAHDPQNAYALYYLGLTLLGMKEHEESRTALQRALKGRDLSPVLKAMTLNLLSYLEIEDHHYPAAIQTAEHSLNVIADQNTAHVFLGIALYKQGEYGRALPSLVRAYRFLRLPPDQRYTRLSQEHTADLYDLAKMTAFCHARAGDYAAAIPLLRQVLEKRSSEGDVWRLFGICCVNREAFEEAVGALKRAMALGVEPTSITLPLAYALLQTGCYNEFMELFLDYQESTPEDVETSGQLLLLMAQQPSGGQHLTKALSAKSQLLRSIPTQMLSQLATALSTSEDAGNTLLELLSAVISRGEEVAALLGAVSDCFQRHRRGRDLANLLWELHRRHPSHPAVLDSLGIAQIKAGDFHAAIATYNQLHQREPYNVAISRRLSGLYAKLGDFEKARSLLQKGAQP